MHIAFNIRYVIRSNIAMSDNNTNKPIGLAYTIRHQSLYYGIQFISFCLRNSRATIDPNGSCIPRHWLDVITRLQRLRMALTGQILALGGYFPVG